MGDGLIRPSRSEFVRIRGLRYHVRRWGDPAKPMLILGHGWLDVSATFHDLVQPLLERYQVLAPDWRGFGHTQWPRDGYWFPDYVADLDALLAHYAPASPVVLVGHSMGAQIMSLYAGLRPERVHRLVCLDGLFLPDTDAERAARRYREWLDRWPGAAATRFYPSFDALAQRIRVQHPQLTPERAHFIARCWGAEDGYGRIRLLADPKHRLPSPVPYRAAESMAIWSRITAPTLFIDAGAGSLSRLLSPEEQARRRACFAVHRAIRIDGAGHMLHFDAPHATGTAIAAFLATA
ncbi:Lysophospholipase, alpha-beta hydrolase superfamily [Fontimonas thermophila]|uniref:Lysophospholipase, alpha-beta hydrolase superfamily n=1 Tax=Fontimonas thermophila TaxID=1076937 RepID=A0A1I2J5H0_9GAMM|nr:alpha/beta hydrolase [Fontimonas thermophila]SFF49083.1 Lysophospholipase, alpha-beta hydrolase superfamily [Fontimonas thermophila]